MFGVMKSTFFLKTVAVFVSWLLPMLLIGVANDLSGVVYFEKNVLSADPSVVARRFLLRCNPCFA
jgi:hypothetical protein